MVEHDAHQIPNPTRIYSLNTGDGSIASDRYVRSCGGYAIDGRNFTIAIRDDNRAPAAADGEVLLRVDGSFDRTIGRPVNVLRMIRTGDSVDHIVGHFLDLLHDCGGALVSRDEKDNDEKLYLQLGLWLRAGRTLA